MAKTLTFPSFPVVKFSNPADMLTELMADVDLYNEDAGYVFKYNEIGSIAVYDITSECARKLQKKSEESGEYWGAFLGGGGTIYDPEEYECRAEGDTTPEGFCEQYYSLPWQVVGPDEHAVIPEGNFGHKVVY